jgi:hypothetical protein
MIAAHDADAYDANAQRTLCARYRLHHIPMVSPRPVNLPRVDLA